MVPDARDCSPPHLDGMLVRLQRIGLVRGWERAPSGALLVAVQAEALCSRAAASSRAVALEGGGGACAAPPAERGWGFWWPRLPPLPPSPLPPVLTGHVSSLLPY